MLDLNLELKLMGQIFNEHSSLSAKCVTSKPIKLPKLDDDLMLKQHKIVDTRLRKLPTTLITKNRRFIYGGRV